jgi:hypothetical protein
MRNPPAALAEDIERSERHAGAGFQNGKDLGQTIVLDTAAFAARTAAAGNGHAERLQLDQQHARAFA